MARAPLFDLDVSVVTPLFGGGATAGVADPLAPVRAASVRGHLRFWWRACKSAGFATADALFDQEEAIWGSTAYPSPVAVTVSLLSSGTRVESREYQRRADGRFPAYALFPYQDVAGAALEGVRFQLRIDLGAIPARQDKPPKTRQELEHAVRAALWAWFTFGGIGARTRRGCGSLYCRDFAPDARTPPTTWLRDTSVRYVDAAPRQLLVPTLSGARLVVSASNSAVVPVDSWRRAVNVMRDFRQAPVGRREGKVPGRSRWPEADSIRRAVQRYDPEAPREHQVDAAYYPRADLGLPIIFQFKQNNRGSEPGDTFTLEPATKGATRMASPIILKPLALSPTKAIPLVVCLDAPHVWDATAFATVLKAKAKYGPQRTVARYAREQLENPALNTSVPPLRQFRAANARDALLAYAEQELGSARLGLGSAGGKR